MIPSAAATRYRLVLIGLLLDMILVGATATLATETASSSPSSVLIIVSYDAFRTEYLRRNSTSFMNELRRNGTTAEYMRNVFPTKTFPNHHSIATGVYPNQHGVMANEFYDHSRGRLNYSYEMFHFNEEIVPIWVSLSLLSLPLLEHFNIVVT